MYVILIKLVDFHEVYIVCTDFSLAMIFFGHVLKLLDLVEFKLKEVISREPTLLVMVLGVPNVGKSALINSIHQIALSRFPGKNFAHHLRAVNECQAVKFLLLFSPCNWIEGMCFGDV